MIGSLRDQHPSTACGLPWLFTLVALGHNQLSLIIWLRRIRDKNILQIILTVIDLILSVCIALLTLYKSKLTFINININPCYRKTVNNSVAIIYVTYYMLERKLNYRNTFWSMVQLLKKQNIDSTVSSNLMIAILVDTRMNCWKVWLIDIGLLNMIWIIVTKSWTVKKKQTILMSLDH